MPINEAARDYHGRYRLPIHWTLSEAEIFGVEYLGYLRLAVSLAKKFIPAGGTIVDLGCGDGRISAALVEAGFKVIGIDYEPQAIGFAKVIVPNAEFHQADLRQETLPLPDASADGVIAIEVIEHIHPRYENELLRNLTRALKPDGIFIYSLPSVRLPLNLHWHFKHYTLEEARAFTAKFGFTTLEIVGNHRLDTGWKAMTFLRRFFNNRLWDIRFFDRLFASWYWKTHTRSDLPHAGRFICVVRKS